MPTLKDDNIGKLMVILSGICWGVISLFIRNLTANSFTSIQIVFGRTVLAAVLLGLYFLVKDRSLFRISIKDVWMFLGSGILSLTFFSYCYFSSIVLSGAAVAVVLLYTSPIFVMLMSAFFFKESITGEKVISLVCTFVGCIFVAGVIGNGRGLSLTAFLLGLGAGFGYALYSIFAGFAVKKYSALTVTFYTLLFSGASLFVICDVKEFVNVFAMNFDNVWWSFFLIALICTVIPYILYTEGLMRMEKGRAAVLVTIEPLVGTLLGIFIHHEYIDIYKILGIVLIFTAMLILSVRKREN